MGANPPPSCLFVLDTIVMGAVLPGTGGDAWVRGRGAWDWGGEGVVALGVAWRLGFRGNGGSQRWVPSTGILVLGVFGAGGPPWGGGISQAQEPKHYT